MGMRWQAWCSPAAMANLHRWPPWDAALHALSGFVLDPAERASWYSRSPLMLSIKNFRRHGLILIGSPAIRLRWTSMLPIHSAVLLPPSNSGLIYWTAGMQFPQRHIGNACAKICRFM